MYKLLAILMALSIGATPTHVDSDVAYNTDDENSSVTAVLSESNVAGVKTNSKGITKLNRAMLKNTILSGNDEAVFSAFSAYSALAAVTPWTSGDTADEITAAVGDIDYTALSAVKSYLPIETGNLFLVDKSLTLNTTDTSGFKFTNLHSASIVSNINNYVAKKTHNLIKGTISEPYDDSVKAVVLDTIYFKGTWQKQFSANATYEDTFYGVTGDEQTKFMHQTSKFDYYANDDFAMIEMGYTNSDLAMDVAVIDNYSSKKDILSAYDFIAKNVSKLETKKVTLSMPKFEIDADLNIINAYKYAGINNLFSASADLSKLADDIYISDVIQKAKIIVDEEGTEAAVVTMMMAELSSALTEPEEIIEMNINKPFVYVIRDTSTNTILFTGYKLNF